MSIKNIYKKGSKVWIPHREKAWEIATISEDYDENKNQLVVENENSKEILILIVKSSSQLPPLCYPQDCCLENKSNLTSLTILHEATIFNALQTRFNKHCIYNYCGIAVVVLNPYTKLSNDEYDKIKIYRRQTISDLEPHIFAIAEKVYRRLERDNYDQSIILTGESGAGKTENAEYIIKYLTTVGVRESQVKEKIILSSKILQAFGNARTINNNNSSRFGKFLELQYDTNYYIIGASIKILFLDRSRIVHQMPNEQNFNIFYQLFLAKGQFPHLQINEEKYYYLNQGNCGETNNTNNLECFDQTINALNVLGFSAKQQDEILRILATILHLGNLNFKKFEGQENIGNVESCFISDLNRLHVLVKLFGLDVKALKTLRKWMCHRRIFSKHDEILQPMTVEQAIKARDALAKFIYTKLFNWIVAQINALFRSPCNVQSFVGIFDFYGFENLSTNSFEQFCINYTDEKIQQCFVQTIFKSEQEEYMREEIEWNFIKFQDNRHCVELIEGRHGIVDIIDEETKKCIQSAKESNTSWIKNLHIKCEKTKNYKKSNDNASDFIVLHFIDSVQYDTNGFIEKNRDIVTREHLEVLKNTKNDLLNKLVSDEFYKLPSVIGKKRTSHSRLSLNIKQFKKMIISEFRNSLASLTTIINKTNQHYVRCIKTNDENKIFKLDPLRVIQQMQAFNILETIRISAYGYFSQQTYENFFERYHCLHRLEKDVKKSDFQEICKTIVINYIQNSDRIKFGKSKVFLREEQVLLFEKLRAEKRERASIVIQKTARSFLQRKRYRDIRRSIVTLQRHVRKYLLCKRLRIYREENAAIKIQAHVRGWLKRKWYQRLRRSIIQIQNFVRLNAEREKLKALQMQIFTSAATELQRIVRGFLARRECKRRIHDIVVIQSCARRFLAKIALDKLKKKRDESIRLLNENLKEKIELLQQKIDYLMDKHFSTKALDALNEIADDRLCVQEKRKILSQLLFQKVRMLKEICKRQVKQSKLPKQRQNGNTEFIEIDNRSVYEVFKSLIEQEEDCILYQQLFQSLYKFDQRAVSLRRNLGLEESEIVQLRISNKISEKDTVLIDKRLDDKNNNIEKISDNASQKNYCNEFPKNNTIKRAAKNSYGGMLQFCKTEVDVLINHLVIELDPMMIITTSPDLPAYILFMCIRYLDILNDASTMFLLLQNYLKTVKQVLKQRKKLDSIALWIANIHRLINLLKQYSKIGNNKNDNHHEMNTPSQNEQCLHNFDLACHCEVLVDTRNWMIKKCTKLVKAHLFDLIIPALIGNETINKLDENLCSFEQETESPHEKLQQLLMELKNINGLFKKCLMDHKIIIQIFKEFFEFLNSIILSDILSRSELCTSFRGMVIRCNLRNIEYWAANHHLLAAVENLKPVIQATRFLQMLPIHEDSIDWICTRFNRLNYDQINSLLSNYMPVYNNENVVSQNVIKKLQYKLTSREEFNDTLPVEENTLSFPFRYSAILLKDIEIPTVLNFVMLKKI